MKLSNTMETCLMTLLDRKDNHHRSAASKRERTVKALARRGLVAYGDLAYGQSYDVVLTADGIREAERIRAERAGEARRIRAERKAAQDQGDDQRPAENVRLSPAQTRMILAADVNGDIPLFAGTTATVSALQGRGLVRMVDFPGGRRPALTSAGVALAARIRAEREDQAEEAPAHATLDTPAGTRVMIHEGRYTGHMGTVLDHNRGRVNNPDHPNHGRAFLMVAADTDDPMGPNRTRVFVEDLAVISESDQGEEAPAPLPRRRPGTAIEDAVKRYRTPLPIPSVPVCGRRFSRTRACIKPANHPLACDPGPRK